MSKPKTDYSHIPPKLLALAKKCRRPPYGMCDCRRYQGELTYNNGYLCDKCKAAAKVYDKAAHYSVAGSNTHRITGRHIDTHALEEYPIETKNRNKSNNPNELLRYGKY